MEPISIVINTLNEEKNIELCLRSVQWAAEVIVVDMFSDDKTQLLAGKFANVKVFTHPRCGYADPAREFAVLQSSFDWVFMLDADELVSYELYLAIQDLIKRQEVDAVRFNRQNYMFGELISCYLWEKDPQLRLFKKSALVGFNPAVHSQFYQFNHDAKILDFTDGKAVIIHFNYLGIEHFISKMNSYTTIEAENVYNGLKKPYGRAKIIRDIFLFIPKFLFLNKGYRNKDLGIGLAVFMLCYKVSAYLKVQLMRKYADPDYQSKIYAKYQKIGTKIIEKY